MAVSFPLVLPLLGPATQYFEIDRLDYQSREAGGRLGGVTAGFPLWSARWGLSRRQSLAHSEAWRATVSLLRGSQRLFYGRDYRRPLPLAYPNGFAGLTRAGGGAFDGTASSWSVNGTRDEVELNGLPAGFQVNVGDYLMWRWTTSGQPRRALCRYAEAGVADGSGDLALTVAMPVPTLVPSGATADLLNPVCLMKLTPETRLGEMDRNGKIDGTIVAMQHLEA